MQEPRRKRTGFAVVLVSIWVVVVLFISFTSPLAGVIFAVVFGGFFYWLYALQIKQDEKMYSEKMVLHKKHGAFTSGIITHFQGLPFPQGSVISVFYGKEKIIFVKEHRELVLNLEKVADMDIVSGDDIQAQMTGAIAGKLLLGGLGGAALGALIATKTYFVVTYGNPGEYKSIILDTSGGELTGDSLKVFDIVRDFRNNHYREIESIEL